MAVRPEGADHQAGTPARCEGFFGNGADAFVIWEVRVKDLDSHAIKALLVSLALLVKIKRDLENQVRGLLKNLGLGHAGHAA
jgi:hypothetical protein